MTAATSIDAKITEALCARLAALSFTPALPVAWPNTDFEPPASAWLRASMMRVRTENVGFTTEVKNGIYQVSVFWPVGAEGAIPADNVAGRIVDHYKRGTWLTNGSVVVRVRNAWAGSAMRDGDLWHVPVTVDWFCQVNGPLDPVITTATPLVVTELPFEIAGTSEAGTEVYLYFGAVRTLGPYAADDEGDWTASITELDDGAWIVTARAFDSAGRESGASNAISLTVDTEAPAAPVITTASPHVTTDTTPTISGTAEASSDLTVYLDGVASGAPVTVDGDGNWSFTFPTLAVGSYSVTATATDQAGNTSAASSALSLTVNAPLAISGTPVTQATEDEEYAGFTVTATGGVPPYTFSIASGALPAGITLDAETGEVSGTPTEAGTFADIVIQVEDSE